MENILKKLKPLDLEYFSRSLGREPTPSELKFISNVLCPVIVGREILPIDVVSQLSDTQDHIFFENLDINVNGKFKGSSFLIRDCALNGFLPEQIDFIFFFKPTKKLMNSMINNELSHLKKINIPYKIHIPEANTAKKQGNMIAIASPPESYFFRILKPKQSIFCLKLPRSSKSYKSEMKINEILNDYSVVTGFTYLNSDTLAIQTLLKRLVDKDVGIYIELLHDMKKGDGVIVLSDEGSYNIKRQLKSQGYDFEKIGKITHDNSHVILDKKGSEKKWPSSLFNIAIHNRNKSDSLDDIQPIDLTSKKQKKISNERLIKLMAKSLEFNTLAIDKTDPVINKEPVVLMHYDSGKKGNYPLETQGIRFVADAIRESVVIGQKIDQILIHYVKHNNSFINGVQIAVKAFQLGKVTQYDFQGTQEMQNAIFCIGKHSIQKHSEPVGREDFISLLGTFKGELNHSLHNQLKGIPSSHDNPGFDATMELNINHTILQGVSTGIIKYCKSIGQGGLMISLLRMYCELEKQFGIKIHISRKLKDEEILFGESFGSELVIIGEKELMEFQRICMTHGIPCSTIGRIREINEISVNKIVSLSSKTLAGLLN